VHPFPTSRRPRSPSPLGLFLTFCLLVGLLFWRLAIPNASPWLDILLLTAAGVFLLWVRARLKNPPGRWRR
jgi:hypothetical protein